MNAFGFVKILKFNTNLVIIIRIVIFFLQKVSIRYVRKLSAYTWRKNANVVAL